MNEAKIRGEYWIQNGQVDFADGDIGDQNHEMIATNQVAYEFKDEIINIAETMNLDVSKVERYGDLDIEELGRLLWEIIEKLQEERHMTEKQADAYLMHALSCNAEALQVLVGHGDSRLYAMKYLGWIAVRSNNAELYGYDNTKKRYLHNGLEEILYNEGIDAPEEEVEIALYDHKTNRSNYVTLADLGNSETVVKTNQNLMTIYNKPIWTGAKTEKEIKSKKSGWNTAAQKAGIIGPGQDLWRGTSEHFSFSEWLKSVE